MKKQSGEQPLGVKEIARRANVAIATVDRVIHNRPGVSPKTKSKIEAIIRELNYQPNILARRLASRHVLRLATLLPKVSSEETDFWTLPVAGIQKAEEEIKQFGVKIEPYYFDLNNRKSFAKVAKQILKNPADGILLAPSFIEESVSFIRSCKELKIPYVFINSDIPQQESLCYIGPDLFRSGYQAGQLIHYCTPRDTRVLVLNVSHEIEDHHHLLRKEEGLRAYFANTARPIVKKDIQQTDPASIEKVLTKALQQHPDTRAVFVTNSRVAAVSRFLEKRARKNKDQNILLIGYDFTKENVSRLDQGHIDFLICQQPGEQGYRGIMALYQHLVMKVPVEKTHFMPIDIITKENHAFYI
ncbi:LacI family DNA-binding transcriptional regulator [Chitinophaga qingshengii]|uniref:LacI family DNA-binding transcriptional regulator n=1 Tax=Chitinophaga qingshengii TaxID=1569794 RepID=A0ABR7THQ0_9BACT|nr:LacI family DNA-binding transcriptional regulator [Chitinophaga qingshengii]MBC9929505.1 LacI family DNA-binding transcriptional regulator [Chitinophaga qingshengii]